MKVPWSYELKRIAPKHAHKFWHPEMLAGIQHAPVYLFPDQAAFDSDAGTGYDHATGEFAGGIDLIHHATGLLASPRASRRRLPHIGSSVFPYGRGCPLTAFAAGSGLRV